MNSETLTLSQKILFDILKSSLWGTDPDKMLFKNVSNATWEEVSRLSVEQGVMGIAFDGVMRLPEDFWPPRTVKIPWAVNTEALSRSYSYKRLIANELATIFGEKDIRMLLIKGFGLSQCYPIPEHREFGDLDIYLLGKFKEGNQILTQNGATKIKLYSEKHDGLIYKNVHIENHNHFLSDLNNPAIKLLENHLLKELKADKSLHNAPLGTILFPSPDFNALFLMCHALRHFTSAVVLRFLCDWACFLHANKGQIDFLKYRQALSDSGWIKVADAFTALTVKYLALDSEMAPPFISDPELEGKIIADMLNPIQFQRKANQTPWKVIVHKYNLMKSRKWKYNLIFPNQFFSSVLNSIHFHIRYPKTILKLK